MSAALLLLFSSLLSLSLAQPTCTDCQILSFTSTFTPGYVVDGGLDLPLTANGIPFPLPSNARILIQTEIEFVNGADADITLTSPSGTSIRITSDNGQAFPPFKDFFNFMWDDNAVNIKFFYNQPIDVFTNQPIGASPSFGPEERLSTFLEEDLNGNWNLHVLDDTYTDSYFAYASSWTLYVVIPDESPNECVPNPCQNGGICSVKVLTAVCDCAGTGFASPTCGVYQNMTFTTRDVKRVPDAQPFSPVISPMSVSGLPSGTMVKRILLSFDVDVDIASNLIVSLTSPSGRRAVVVDQSFGLSGSSGNQPFSKTIWADGFPVASSFNGYYAAQKIEAVGPEMSFASFLSEDLNGLWSLSVADAEANDLGDPTGTTDSTILFRGFSLIFEVAVSNGPVYEVQTYTKGGSDSGTTGQISLIFEGPFGTSGPHNLGAVFQDSGIDIFPKVHLTKDIGPLWSIKLFNSMGNDAWEYSLINVVTPLETVPFSNGRSLKTMTYLEAPFKMVVVMRASKFDATRGAIYCTFTDVNGRSISTKISNGFGKGTTTEIDLPFINVADIKKITLGNFSADKWRFQTIRIIKRGVTTVFTYSGTISRFNNRVTIFPQP